MNQLTIEQAADLLLHYDQWLVEHMDELADQHPGKIVAVENGQVVAVGTTYKEVCSLFENQERDWMPLSVEVPYPGETQGYLL